MTRLRLSVTMLSDWHVGSGTGRHGFLDRAVQRDPDGLPFVPAKTLAGVWRDGCETVAYALDGGRRGPWHSWLDWLFGTQPALEARGVVEGTHHGPPRPAALHLDSLHFPAAVTAALREKPLLRQSATFVKPGVAIDRETGTAAEGMLRFEEMARGGAVLVGTAEIADSWRLTDDQVHCATALLHAAARLVEGIGGKRRRGAGRCRLDVGGLAADWRWLQGRDHPPQVPEPTPASVMAPPAGRTAVGWEIADLRLVLRRPLIAHEQTMGNSVRSAEFVPGRTLLPAVLQRLNAPQAAAAARAGDLIVTDATIEIDGHPGRPAPLVLVHPKGRSERAYNVMCETMAAGTQAVPYEGYYVGEYEHGRLLRLAVCPRSEHTHNTIDDRFQRPVEAVGGLYTYQAIAAGTVLRAQVRVPSGLLGAGWQDLLAGTWRVGRARKDGYGLTDVSSAVAEPRTSSAPPDGRLRVWLLSDTLVTDERLRPSTDPIHLAAELGRALGVELCPVSDNGSGGAVDRASETRRSDPWHSRWSLPRASLLALRAGSCLSFDVVQGTVTAAAVQQVELAGVGLRRAEGFGQVRIADPILHSAFDGACDVTSVDAPSVQPVSADSPAPEDVSELVRVWEEAAWRGEIQRASETAARERRHEILGNGYEKVPSSQLGALRTLITGLDDPSSDSATEWLKRVETVRTARQAPWPDDVVQHLRSVLTEPHTVWQLLRLPEGSLVVEPGGAARLRRSLWAEAVRTLVEDCLTAHARSADAREGG
ncbi:RAMP superfamily CRISPR-associated protein [Streptomyces cellulosae]